MKSQPSSLGLIMSECDGLAIPEESPLALERRVLANTASDPKFIGSLLPSPRRRVLSNECFLQEEISSLSPSPQRKDEEQSKYPKKLPMFALYHENCQAKSSSLSTATNSNLVDINPTNTCVTGPCENACKTASPADLQRRAHSSHRVYTASYLHPPVDPCPKSSLKPILVSSLKSTSARNKRVSFSMQAI